jgi:hypothetical protein
MCTGKMRRDTGQRCVPGFVRGTLLAYWSANERAPFVPRLVPTFRQIGDAGRNSAHFRTRYKRVGFVHSYPLPLKKKKTAAP